MGESLVRILGIVMGTIGSEIDREPLLHVPKIPILCGAYRVKKQCSTYRQLNEPT